MHSFLSFQSAVSFSAFTDSTALRLGPILYGGLGGGRNELRSPGLDYFDDIHVLDDLICDTRLGAPGGSSSGTIRIIESRCPRRVDKSSERGCVTVLLPRSQITMKIMCCKLVQNPRLRIKSDSSVD